MIERRSFLRGLTALPLIGGAVSIVGNPTKAAVPITERLLDQYIAWLAHEHREALAERATWRALARAPRATNPAWSVEEEVVNVRRCPPMFWFPDRPEVERLVTGTAALHQSRCRAERRRMRMGGVIMWQKSTPTTPETRLSRRAFVMAAGTTAAGTVVAAASSTISAAEDPGHCHCRGADPRRE